MVVSVTRHGEPIIARTDDGTEVALWRAFRTSGQLSLRQVPIMLVHGTFSDRHFFGGRYGLAQYLADRGHDAWVAELRGRRPPDPSQPARDWGFDDWIVRDAPALLRAIQDATDAPRVLWVGHSAGAVIGLGCAARAPSFADRLAGLLMIAAPAPHAPGPIHLAASGLGHLVGRAMGRFPARALRIGPVDERPGILREWFGWNSTGRWTSRDGFDYVAGARNMRAPVFAIAGGADLLAPPSSCRRLLDAVGSGDRDMMVCSRSEGFSRNYTHNQLVISPAARQEVWPRLARWIAERFW